MDEVDWLIDYTNRDPALIWKDLEGKFDRAIPGLLDPQMTYLLVWGLEGEVNNGGFEQFISNSTGDTAELVPEALRRVGAEACARLVERALRTLSPDPLPTDSEERRALLDQRFDAIDRPLNELDDAFYDGPDDLTHLLYLFIHRHPDDFNIVSEHPDPPTI